MSADRALPTPSVSRAIRQSCGLSQARVALELGVSRMTVSRWERGARRPRGLRLVAYTALLSDLAAAAKRGPQ
ncbi:helix-turn-helix domain-containing protein [Demequina activiva]|uniref:helix-turn-helix domain-containing protein n=1 Tax=Demequina activiva TaxID=1582364 RepID=UPI001945AF35